MVGSVGTPNSAKTVPMAAEVEAPYVGPYTGAEFLRDAMLENVVNVRASYAISASQVMLVRNSFAKVQLIADTAADLFYARLFELAPPVRRLFPADMTAQKRKLIAMLGLAVANLDTPEAFVAAVTELGRRHVAYGTVAAHFEPVGAALLWTLEQGLGPDFSPELRQAWSETFDIVASVMQSAADARAA